MGASVSVLGASGYTGGELVRLVAGHPAASLVAVGAHRRAGDALASVHPQLAGLFDDALLDLDGAAATPADVCFSCLPSGTLEALVEEVAAPVIVDLADDFRSTDGWVYGLTEFARPEVTGAARIANPGCYPTATLLCLVPFARAGVVTGPVVVDAISGVSGAGRAAEDRLMFATLDGSVAAYGTTTHRHVGEIERYLAGFGGLDTTVSFTPHLAPMARGLLVTARAHLTSGITDTEAFEILADAYSNESFVQAVSGWPATKPLCGTNRAHVAAHVDERNGLLVCSAAIDNLGKGAAGQALQNANVALGLSEGAGLDSWGVWP